MPASIDARPFLVFSSCVVASSLSTAETLFRPRFLTSATSVGLSSGMPGTYHDSEGSALTSPLIASMRPLTIFLHEPQPVPARVALPTAGTVVLPARMAATMVPLQTPLQSQICLSSGMSARLNSSPRTVAPVKNISSRRAGAGASVMNSRTSSSAGPRSPNMHAAATLPSRTIAFQ